MNVSAIILLSLAVGENAIVYNFIQRLVKSECVCSQDPRREAITLMTVFNFVTIMIAILQPQIAPSSYRFILGIYSMIYFGIVLSYTHGLWNSNCKCSKGVDLTWIYITRVIDVALLSMILIGAMLMRSG